MRELLYGVRPRVPALLLGHRFIILTAHPKPLSFKLFHSSRSARMNQIAALIFKGVILASETLISAISVEQKKAAALYTQAGDYQKTARFYCK